MSSYFLTKDLAAEKLENPSSAGGTGYVTKAECLEMGADPDRLAGYRDYEYPIDDDIQSGTLTCSFQIWINEEGSPMDLGAVFGGEVMYYYVIVER